MYIFSRLKLQSGPVVGAYLGSNPNVDWRWVEWLILILTGISILCVLLFALETFPPRILYFKALAFRKLTGDPRFKTAQEAVGTTSASTLLKRSLTRPFILALEPIVIAFTIYMVIAYIILFTFLDGYVST